MLPFEDRARQDIADTFSKELAACRDLLQLALDVLGCDNSGNLQIPSTSVLGVGEDARSLALGLYAKAIKQFRCMTLLGEAGFGSEVTVLTRTLFETALALEFVMKAEVTLKRGSKIVNFDKSRPLTTDFRAMLYAARVAFEAERHLKNLNANPVLGAHVGILENPMTIAANATAAKNAVGHLWWEQLKRGYAGLNVRDLAGSLGVGDCYELIYGPQSEVVHAGDAFGHFDVSNDQLHCLLALSPAPDEIGPRLQLASLIFLGCVASLHNRLRFGPNIESRINEFAKQLGVPAHT
jgi:Family of unknown function (DUF5677)